MLEKSSLCPCLFCT